jgi:hypothetical protein
MGLTISLASTTDQVEAARGIEETVFGEAFGNTPEQLAVEYGPYEDVSRFLLCHDDINGYPVGVARLIAPSPAGLKTLVDITADPWRAEPERAVRRAGLDMSRTWDVATLAVLPEARRGHVSAALYAALLDTLTFAGATSWTAIVDSNVLLLLRRAGVAVEAIPGLQGAPYLGSASSVPVFGHLSDTRLRVPRPMVPTEALVA